MKYLFKLIVSLFIVFILILSISACSNRGSETTSSPRPTPTLESPQETTPTPPQEPLPTPDPVDLPEGVMISYDNYVIRKVSDDPLFRANGRVDMDVLNSLIGILNFPALDPMQQDREITAEEFSYYVFPRMTDTNRSGAIVIKLFETIPEREGVHNKHLTEFTSQWWQLVYRTAEDGNDVLTLWMMQPYRVTPFNGTRYDNRVGNTSDRFTDRMRSTGDSSWSRIQNNSINTVLSDEQISMGLPPCSNYYFEGNYSTSIARDNLLRDTDSLLNHFNISSYLVSPSGLHGLWQSSAFQTGTNRHDLYYVSGQFFLSDRRYSGSENEIDGAGAAGFIWGNRNFFALGNGMDGLSVGPFNGNWPNTLIESIYDDLFWLPSDFEVRTMGYNKESARSITLVADVDNTGTIIRPNSGYETEAEETDEDSDNIDDYSETGRTGLWRLNGFDRAFDRDGLNLPRGWMTEQVWLRSQDSLAIGNGSMVANNGGRYTYGVHQLAGMRPAVHLSITELINLIGD